MHGNGTLVYPDGRVYEGGMHAFLAFLFSF